MTVPPFPLATHMLVPSNTTPDALNATGIGAPTMAPALGSNRRKSVLRMLVTQMCEPS